MPSVNVICCHCGSLVEEFRWRRLHSTTCDRCAREGRSDVIVQMPLNFDMDLARGFSKTYGFQTSNGNGHHFHSSPINSIKSAVTKKLAQIIKKKRPLKETIIDA